MSSPCSRTGTSCRRAFRGSEAQVRSPSCTHRPRPTPYQVTPSQGLASFCRHWASPAFAQGRPAARSQHTVGGAVASTRTQPEPTRPHVNAQPSCPLKCFLDLRSSTSPLPAPTPGEVQGGLRTHTLFWRESGLPVECEGTVFKEDILPEGFTPEPRGKNREECLGWR